MASKNAEALKKGDVIRNAGQTYVVTGREVDANETVVIVHVVGHSPFAYNCGQKVRTA